MSWLKRILTGLALCLVALNFGLVSPRPSQAQSTEAGFSACDDVSFLMARDLTPYDLALGGGALSASSPARSTLGDSSYADFWAFNATGGGQASFNLSLSGSLSVEAALYFGMGRPDGKQGPVVYETFSGAGGTLSAPLRESGLYTLVVKRTRLSDPANVGDYQISFNAGGAQISPPPASRDLIRDATNNAETRINSESGYETLTSTAGTLLRANAGGVTQIGTASQGLNTYFVSFRLLAPTWVKSVAFLGGDLALKGEENGRKRIFFLENYNWRTSFTENFRAFTDGQVSLVTNFDEVAGVWMFNDCYGFKTHDGFTFTTPIAPEKRTARVGSDPASDCRAGFRVGVTALDRANAPLPHRLCFNWVGIEPNSELSLENSVLTARLIGARLVRLFSTNLDLFRQPPTEGLPPENALLNASLNDQLVRYQNVEVPISLQTDWQTLGRLEYTPAADTGALTLTLEFINQAARSVITRDASQLARFVALEGVVEIFNRDLEGQTLGEQRLLLGENLGFIELITPPGLPLFDPLTVPSGAGYFARGLNNLGGDCLRVNSVFPEANCPLNGEVNPANSNLWYGVTDLSAKGALLDLALARHYNSADPASDGTFGKGWSTAFLLDYATPFDNTQGTRPITAESVAAHRVGLNVIYAPRGIVVFTTPSGSRHTFVTTDSTPAADEIYVAVGMPGWQVGRVNSRSNWILTQHNGLTYEFDPAGRLVRYGYPARQRVVDVNYPRDTQNGASNTVVAGSTDLPALITLTDGNDQRRLELYYGANQRVVMAILRDLTRANAGELERPLRQLTADLNAGATPSLEAALCLPTETCFGVIYSYDEAGHLVNVAYADGTSATYAYDGPNGQLSAHSDPAAPFATDLIYAYDVTTGRLLNVLGQDGTAYRTLSPGALANKQFCVDVTDENAVLTTYCYRAEADEKNKNVRQAGDIWTLASTYTPAIDLNNEGKFFVYGPASIATTYSWENGLLKRVAPPSDTPINPKRNTTLIAHNAFGDLTSLGLSRLNLTLSYDEAGRPIAASFGDGTSLRIELSGETGLPARVTDRYGAIYTLAWDVATGQPASLTRENDGVSYAYTYAPYGLVTGVDESLNGSVRHSLRYTYDGLGRLLDVQDATYGLGFCVATPEGAHTCAGELSYSPPSGADPADLCLAAPDLSRATRITSTLGDTRIEVRDVRGLVLDRLHLAPDSPPGGFLRRTVYTYDALGRMTSQTPCLLNEDGTSTPLTTTYTHKPTTIITPDASLSTAGYAISSADPFGRGERWIYDGRDRLSIIQGLDGRQTDFYYRAGGSEIRQIEIIGENIVSNIIYRFNVQWQLTGLDRIWRNGKEYGWEFRIQPETSSSNMLSQESRIAENIFTSSWGEFRNGIPTTLKLTQSAPERGGETEINPQLTLDYDFLRRPILWQQGEDKLALRLSYEEGGWLTCRSVTGAPAGFTCADANNLAQATQVNGLGQVVAVTDDWGRRLLVYTAENGGWTSIVTAQDPQGAQSLTWTLRYGVLGQLLEWTDEYGNTRRYTYDSVGRLIRTDFIAPDGTPVPQGSFSYRYNELGLLTQELDDLGRGTSYAYDRTGRLSARQNINTGDLSTYAYSPEGLVTSLIDETGRTFIYSYEDQLDPTRLTRITVPTGGLERFEWNNDNLVNRQGKTENVLSYFDPLGRQTDYYFDVFGLLRQIVDSESKVYTLTYDTAGNLTGWDIVGPNNTGQTFLFSYVRGDVGTLEFRAVEEDTRDWDVALGLNSLGNLINLLNPDDLNNRFTYDSLGRYREIGDWQLTRDPAAQSLTVNSPFGSTRTLQHNPLYRLLGDGVFTYSYTDDLGSYILEVRHPSLGTRTYTFEAGDSTIAQPATVTLDAPGQRITYIFDAAGDLTDIIKEVCVVSGDPLAAGVREISLDNCDEVEVDGQAGAVWRSSIRVEHDAGKRVTRLIDEEQNSETFAYDDADNLLAYQNVDGQTYTYTYDRLDRLQTLTSTTGVRLVFGYNVLDKVTGICRVRAESGITRFQDCPPENVLEEYRYDKLGRLTQRLFRDRAGKPLAYEYDYATLGLLSAWGAAGRLARLNYDALGLAVALDSGAGAYKFERSDLHRLRTAGDLSYSYSDDGLLAQTGALTFTFDPVFNNQILSNGRAQLNYQLYPNGMLGVLSGSVGDNALGVVFSYGLSQDDSSVLVVEYDDTNLYNLFALTDFKAQADLVNFFGTNPLLLDYQRRGQGQIERHQLISPELYGEETGGYILTIGYDNDARPLNVRVNTLSSARVRYIQTYNYNPLGQLTSELRQYEDDSQLRSIYTYDVTGTLLLLRETRLALTTRPNLDNLQQGSAWVLGPALVIAGLWAWRSPKRRRTALLLMLALGLGLSALPHALTHAQSALLQTYRYGYTYDAAGNLSQIILVKDIDRNGNFSGPVCVSYSYDALNRLTGVVFADGTRRAYTYDAYNRLTAIDNLQISYLTNSTKPIGSSANGGTLVASLNEASTLFSIDAKNATWFYHDGNTQTRGLVASEPLEAPQNPWLFDPLGRYIQFTPPALPSADDASAPCALLYLDAPTREALAPLAPPQVVMDGMVWDSTTNLFFRDGRAYSAELGRYLQRDPRGVTLNGDSYSYSPPVEQPPLAKRIMPLLDGLRILSEAEAVAQITNTLQAEDVLARHLPRPLGYRDLPYLASINDSRDKSAQRLADLANLPNWLQENYNLPTARFDPQTGVLRQLTDNAPGQGGWGTAHRLSITPFLARPFWAAETLPSVVSLWEAEQARRTLPNYSLSAYDPYTWQPTLRGTQAQPSAPLFDASRTPASVLNFLAYPLQRPQDKTATLSLALEIINDWVQRPPADWLEMELKASLPVNGVPSLPRSVADWRETIFDEDILGTAASLGQPYDALPAEPDALYFGYDASLEWLFVGRPE